MKQRNKWNVTSWDREEGPRNIWCLLTRAARVHNTHKTIKSIKNEGSSKCQSIELYVQLIYVSNNRLSTSKHKYNQNNYMFSFCRFSGPLSYTVCVDVRLFCYQSIARDLQNRRQLQSDTKNTIDILTQKTKGENKALKHYPETFMYQHYFVKKPLTIMVSDSY